MQMPRITKITVNIGLGEALTDANALDKAADDVAAITGQKPVITRAKRSIANFRLREGNPIGVAATLRGAHMWEFLDRLVSAALPRIRDFQGLNPNAFDGRGNYSLGLREQLIFPEIDYDRVDKVRGMQVTIVTTATDRRRRPQAPRAHGPAIPEELGSRPWHPKASSTATSAARAHAKYAARRAECKHELRKSWDDPERSMSSMRSCASCRSTAAPRGSTTATWSPAGRRLHPQVRSLAHHLPRTCARGLLPGVTKSSW